ncbi:plasma kallikrein-like [Lineus longissimus]|uniref:plasma kallikrein-like n=1 Tax=Lineus longissimus TaxID=88925 RepID=UPI00315DEAD6
MDVRVIIFALAGLLAAVIAVPADKTEETEDLFAVGDLSSIDNIEELLGEFTTEEIQKRIISGHRSKVGDWPWLIGIHKAYIPGVICGGSIVDATTIVTAAHCFGHSQRPSDFTVLVGETNLRAIKSEQKFKVIAVRPHIGYRFRMGPDSPNDIAILKLSRPITFSKAIKPIGLPSGPHDAAAVDTACAAGGWGRTQARDWALEMFHVSIKIRPMEICMRMYSNNRFDYPGGRVCAGGHTFSNVCVGDSGGPLACKRHGKYVLEGVVSFGAHFCGKQRRKYPTVFTRVAAYLDWIQENRH